MRTPPIRLGDRMVSSEQIVAVKDGTDILNHSRFRLEKIEK